MPKFRDLSNQRFGKLLAVSLAGKNPQGKALWLCQCDCGNQKIIRQTSLTSGDTTSCGCHRIAISKINIKGAAYKHGQSQRRGEFAKEYSAWAHMIQRCYDKNSKDYKSYGAQGISVCNRWRFGEDNKSGFECFLEDVGPSTTKDHSLDRFPNISGNYEPENCQWSTRKEQAQHTKRNMWITYQGKTLLSNDWARLSGIDPHTIRMRINRGWSAEEALTIPIRPYTTSKKT